jgi:hypothetical protein
MFLENARFVCIAAVYWDTIKNTPVVAIYEV